MAQQIVDFTITVTADMHDGQAYLPIDFPLSLDDYIVAEEYGEPLIFWREDIEDPWPGKIPQITIDDIFPDTDQENWETDYLANRFAAVDAINAMMGFDTMAIVREGKCIISCQSGLIATISKEALLGLTSSPMH